MSKAVAIPGVNKAVGGIKEEIYVSPTEKKDGAMGYISRFLRFDSLAKKASTPESPTSTEPLTTYYGVYIPCEMKKGPDEEALHVYKNKSEALELVRRYKAARFKAFRNRQDAVSFALRGAEPQDVTDGADSSLMGEKPYPFKAPSPQEMVALRKAIEAGLATTVRDRVWDNPRFLVSSGNTPAIMQEGSRYNALHIAAKAMNADLCNLILTTVGNPCFVQTLYGADSDLEACKEFAEILVDRYLNTPDKAMNETPLHFAAKYGAEGVVDVLTSFAQCDKNAVNKFGERPRDIICKRASNPSAETISRISAMLEERYYVPVLHSENDSAAPAIGRPFTPSRPPEINDDPLSPRYEIRAFAGPMQPAAAEAFRRRWKTPPRAPSAPAATAPAGSPSPARFRLQEITKGFETVGRNLAEEMKVGWKEYWPFLDTFTDLRTPEGLALLENYLKAKYESACSFAYSDSCIEAQHSPEELLLSRLSQGLSHSSSQSPTKDSGLSPMSELCNAMNTCKITDRPPHWRKTDPIRQRLCRQPSLKKISNGDTPPTINHTVSQLLCIERTCQVFAKRIADALVFSLTAEPEVAGESLKSEAKHLQHTILTYMDDERFQKIDFSLTHSRLAQLVVYKLKQQTKYIDDINSLVEFLVKLRCPNDDIFSSDDERKPSSARGPNRLKISHVIVGHVRCLASFICEELTEVEVTKGPAVSESECTEIWQKAAKCRCDWKVEVFERNSKKNSSFRKSWSLLSTSPKGESFIRRLTFDYDIGDGTGKATVCARAAPVNSPAGDTAQAPPSKQHVQPAQISEDESADSESSEEAYLTASEQMSGDSEQEMDDASDRALAEPFIYGEEPTKMDRLVFDCISTCNISAEQYPNVFRWRHTVALYSPAERDKWVAVSGAEESVVCAVWPGTPQTPRTPQLQLQSPGNSSRRSRVSLSPAQGNTGPAARSTPHKESPCSNNTARAVPLQVSNWLRVTGAHSPRAALSKNLSHNASFGF